MGPGGSCGLRGLFPSPHGPCATTFLSVLCAEPPAIEQFMPGHLIGRLWHLSDDEDVQKAITYFVKQSGAGRMDYAARVAVNEPIGSGVTEAACKVIVKQRLCGSGMKWTEGGAAVVLSLRALSYTPERWSQFWSKVARWGFPVAA